MNIFLALLIALLAILGAIALRCIDDRFETVIRAYNANTINIMTHVEANKNRALNNADRIAKQDEEIESILARFESIVNDIHRLDEDVKTIDKSEREIRSYYINFREPTGVPNGGVPWASEYKTGEDND